MQENAKLVNFNILLQFDGPCGPFETALKTQRQQQEDQ